MEEGETLPGALRQEVREESGFDVVAGEPSYASTFERPGPDGSPVTILAIEHLCETDSREPLRLSPYEHDAGAWVRDDGLRAYPLVPTFAPTVPRAFQLRPRLGERPAGRDGSERP